MFCGPEVFWGKVRYRIWNPHRISKSTKKELFKSAKNHRNYALIKKAKIVMFCGPEVIWGKAQYRIWNPHRISM